jgi:soluble lytic murein transglycosylase
MKRLAFVFAALWASCMPQFAAGMECPAMPDSALRSAFVEAERSPPRGRSARERLRDRLGDYPLYPYVELARLRDGFPHVARSDLESFLDLYEGEAPTLRLRNRWLRRLANHGEWNKFIEWYPPDASTELRCRHARALLETGDEAGAFTAARKLWLADRSQPKACDPVFAKWLKSDRFSPSLAWERVGLAMARGNTGLTRYLERFLDPVDRKMARAWRKVHTNPRRVADIALDGDPSQVDAIVVHAVKRLASKDPEAAVRVLARATARFELGAAARAGAARHIGLSFARRHDPRAVDWLGRVEAAHADVYLQRWRAAAAALHSRWDEVLEGIAGMPEEERDRERWRYWRARALEATGREQEAREEFASLARERDYYGFLAADRLGSPYRFNHRPLAVAPEIVDRVATIPAARRALELLSLERRVDARREWRELIKRLGEEELKAASWLAQCRDWHGRAILTIARTPERDDLALRFPMDFREAVESASKRQSLAPATVYAFIRKESAFMPDARSGKGALGLMQILPRTGRMLMKARGETLSRNSQLLSPVLNVNLGTQYIRSLLGKTGGSLVLAAASYNAGPHRVRSWLPEEGEVEADVWIDNIPFTETRRYVRGLLAYIAIYEHRLGQTPMRLRDRMPPVPSRSGI